MSENRVAYTQWLQRGVNTFFPTDNSVTRPSVPAGVYQIKYADNIGYYLMKKELNLDELIDLPMPEGIEVIDGIKTFWERESKFKEYGYAYKRGILLYGVPGAGKTCIIERLCKNLIDQKDGVVFTLSSENDLSFYLSFMPEIYRVIEKDRPIVTIIEDIDGLCQHKEAESKLLNVLDGMNQFENVVYIATTNYTERLSERILNRPNRFDRRIEVKSPNDECRRMYFRHKLKPHDLAAIDIDVWVKKTKGMSMAHLGEVIKSVLILGNDFNETIERLIGMRIIPVSRNYDKEFSGRMGFDTNRPKYEGEYEEEEEEKEGGN